MSLALGLSIASKWTGLFGIVIMAIIYLGQLALKFKKKNTDKRKPLKSLIATPLFFLIIPLLVYLAVYLPFFARSHTPPGNKSSVFNVETFIGLQQQMYWYHTNLKATHSYQSTPVQWIFDLRPVWLYVDYQKNSIANIYTLGNPLFMWFGLISIVFLFWKFIKIQAFNVGVVLLFYFGFFIPWIHSPRIMFNYHYLPAVPFLSIAIGITLNQIIKEKKTAFVIFFFLTLLALFIYFYPLWTGIYIPRDLYNSYFWFNSWK